MFEEDADQAPEESLAEDDLAELRTHIDRTLTADEQALVDRLNQARARIETDVVLMERQLFLNEVMRRARRDFIFAQLINLPALKREIDEVRRLIDRQRGPR